MIYTTRPGRMGETKLEEYEDDGVYVRLIAEFFYDNDAEAIRDALNSGNIKFPAPHKKAVEQVVKEHWGALNRLEDNDYYRHKKEDCVVWQEGGIGCPDCIDDGSDPLNER